MKSSEFKIYISVKSYEEKTPKNDQNWRQKFHVPILDTFQEISRQKALGSGRLIVLNDLASPKIGSVLVKGMQKKPHPLKKSRPNFLVQIYAQCFETNEKSNLWFLFSKLLLISFRIFKCFSPTKKLIFKVPQKMRNVFL